MQTYDVREQSIIKIKTQKSKFVLTLNPSENVEEFYGYLDIVQVVPIGRRVIITSDSPAATPWGYCIDYDADGNVMQPLTIAGITRLIEDLTAIGCCEYTPDLLRAINDRRQVQAGMQSLLGEGDKIHKIRL